jgi:peptidoglycan hydrolase-like protein with peptidoglycan-binding domain
VGAAVAEFSARRVVAIAALAGALVGGAVAGVVSAASASGNGNNRSAAGGGSVATAAVVRTTLTNSVQVGGSIGYDRSYTIAAPSGTSPQQMVQARQAVTQDRQLLSADERTEADTASADSTTVAGDRTNVRDYLSALSSDRAKRITDCAGMRAASPRCSQAAQKVSQDRAQLTQAEQQLAAAQSTATLDHDQDQAKVVSDETKLRDDRASLASLQASAVTPGTTYTWLPNAGDVIKEDERVYSLGNAPVPLLYGSLASYRAFYAGMPDGADVGELTRDLIALGYGAGLTQSNHYSSTTAAAVRRWQGALGLPATGEILLGEVVFEPGPIRVTSVTPSVGSSVGSGGGAGGGGTVLTATSTTPIVTVDLDVSDEYLVRPGDRVSVVLPNGSSRVAGHIETVGNVATCPGGGAAGLGGGNGAGSADQSPCESTGSGNSSNPTVTVTIALDRSPRGATLDQAPVNVNITTQRARHVLAVPVNALLALQGGGFGVDVVNGNTSRLVGVTTGLYSDSKVQVSGSDITVGTRVEVPSS